MRLQCVSSIIARHRWPSVLLQGSLHRRFYDSLGDQDVPHSIDREFNAPGLFVGAALTLEVRRYHDMVRRKLTLVGTRIPKYASSIGKASPGVNNSPQDVSKVAKASGVKAVRPLHIFPGPE